MDNYSVLFEWDEEKDRINQKKNGLSFDDTREGEHRWQIMGHLGGILLVLVVYTIKERENEEVFRLISARKEQITTRIDADILQWLKSHGKGYQTLLNALLRKQMNEECRKEAAGKSV